MSLRAHSGDFNVEKYDVYNFFKLFFRGRFIVFDIYRLNFLNCALERPCEGFERSLWSRFFFRQ